MNDREYFLTTSLSYQLQAARRELADNLCERKARVLKGKINQAISLRSFEHLTYFCECLSVLDNFATNRGDNLYESVKGFSQDRNPFNRNLRNRNPPIQHCLNVRQDKGLLRVPCYRTLFSPPVKSNRKLIAV